MVETGDWVTPRLYGKPWFEKPVLYYWGAALSFKWFGVSEAAARLPSAISALLATLALAWLARRLYGTETALWLLLLLPTTVGMIGFSHAAATDMPFAATLTIAMVFAAVILGLTRNADTPILPHTPWLALLFFGFFLGLAVLAKGPAAIVLASGAVLFWALFTKRWRDAFRCLHPAAIASFCLTALPWYILCARRNPDFFRVFIIEHNFKRYLTPEFQHIQPFWFYAPILLVAAFPWTLLLIPLAAQLFDAIRKRSTESAQLLFFVSWPAFTFLFFTVSKSKLPGYILPAVPPLLLLFTKAAIEIKEKNPQRWLIFLLGASLAVLSIAFAFSYTPDKLAVGTCRPPWPDTRLIALTALLAGVFVAVLGLPRRGKIALLAIVISILLLVVEIDGLLPKFDPGLTARTSLREAARLWPGFTLNRAATWQLKRSLFYQLNFYAHTELLEWEPGEPKPQWLFVEPRLAQQARALGFSCHDYPICRAVISCENQTLARSPGGPGALGRNNNLGAPADRQPH